MSPPVLSKLLRKVPRNKDPGLNAESFSNALLVAPDIFNPLALVVAPNFSLVSKLITPELLYEILSYLRYKGLFNRLLNPIYFSGELPER